MAYSGYVAEISALSPHPNADRLQIATIFDNSVVVGLDCAVGDKGIYFPSDGQLSYEFCLINNLYRKHPVTGEKMGGYFESNRRVRIQKFRGVISNGFFAPLSYFDYTGVDRSDLHVGLQVDEFNGHKFCNKYISEYAARVNAGTKRGRWMVDKYPDFFMVGDTINLNYSGLSYIDEPIVITEKLHGTSGRTGYIKSFPPEKKVRWYEKLWRVFRPNMDARPYAYEYVSGTRRTVLEPDSYHSKDSYRIAAHSLFEGKLHEGEIVYYEIVGFDSNGAPIQGAHDVTKFPEIQHDYSNIPDKMHYSYKCKRGEHAVFVYRIGVVLDDGCWVEYPWESVVERCKEIGVRTVPELMGWHFRGSLSDLILTCRELNEHGVSYTDDTHVIEGVCVRIGKTVYKYKSDYFCMLEDIAKDSEKYIDQDEAN